MAYVPDDSRYEDMLYRYTGRSGLRLPVMSLGLWHNFGDDVPLKRQRDIIHRAIDLGITHFDLANNYGPPFGSAELNFGHHLARDLRPLRDELVIATKAGYDMWPGPYGSGGSRKHVMGSLDQSLTRMGLDYVDIFYSHRVDVETPLEETMDALVAIHRSGKARYVGISSYSPERTREAARLLGEAGVPLLVHQASYSMFNRWIEESLLETLAEVGAGCIGFSPLGQGLLTDRYLGGIPKESRAAQGKSFNPDLLHDEMRDRIRGLNDIAANRGQTLAQLALAWALRDDRMTSVVLGASSVEQLEQNVMALDGIDFTRDELTAIDALAVESGINLWKRSSDA